MSLILEGFMGSGKSAVGASLAGRLGIPFVDTDREIETRQGCSIADIFCSSGEEAFRQMETSMLQGLYLTGEEAVISLGGGTPMRDINASVIRRLGSVIYLKAPAQVLVRRLENETEERPMLEGYDLVQRVDSLLKEREGRYIELADVIIDVSDGCIADICDSIIKETGI